MWLGLHRPDLGAFRNSQVYHHFWSLSKNIIVGYILLSQERRAWAMESRGSRTNIFSFQVSLLYLELSWEGKDSSLRCGRLSYVFPSQMLLHREATRGGMTQTIAKLWLQNGPREVLIWGRGEELQKPPELWVCSLISFKVGVRTAVPTRVLLRMLRDRGQIAAAAGSSNIKLCCVFCQDKVGSFVEAGSGAL